MGGGCEIPVLGVLIFWGVAWSCALQLFMCGFNFWGLGIGALGFGVSWFEFRGTGGCEIPSLRARRRVMGGRF